MRFIEQRLKTGEIVVLDKRYHRYYLKDNKKFVFTPSTTFIDKFFPKFDRNGISKRYAKKHKLDRKQVLKEWDKKGRDARKIGDNCHLYVEKYFKNKKLPKPKGEREERLFMTLASLVTYLEASYEFLLSEWLVASLNFKLAGVVDLIMRDGNRLVIFDIKTAAEIKEDNIFQSGYPPLEHLDDCNYNKYSLQLNLYKGMVRAHFEDRYEDYVPYILHVREDKFKVIEVPNMMREIKDMLSWK